MALEPVGVGAQVELAGLGEAALLAVVRGQPRPEHVAIIMDGNGRWATRRGLPRVAGHREGVKAARTIVCAASGGYLYATAQRGAFEVAPNSSCSSRRLTLTTMPSISNGSS